MECAKHTNDDANTCSMACLDHVRKLLAGAMLRVELVRNRLVIGPPGVPLDGLLWWIDCCPPSPKKFAIMDKRKDSPWTYPYPAGPMKLVHSWAMLSHMCPEADDLASPERTHKSGKQGRNDGEYFSGLTLLYRLLSNAEREEVRPRQPRFSVASVRIGILLQVTRVL